jgi:hypothetical protein
MGNKFYDLGTTLDGKEVFRLLEEHLATGIVVNGTTGGGKSRFLHKLISEHVRWRRGFLLIDPGDLADDVLAAFARRIADTKDDRLLKKLHVLELNPAQMARYDLFQPPDLKLNHPEVRAMFLRAWQHTKVQSASEVFLRIKGQTEFGVQVRLQRLLSNVFTCVSTMVDRGHLPVGKALVLLDREHPDHLRVYERLKPFLPREVVADFETLHTFRRVQDLRTETESTLNTLRAELGPLMTNFLSGTGREPSFSMQRAVEDGAFVLVSVKKTLFTSHKQNVALAAMLVHDWFEALLNCPREKRRGSTLIIDELHQFLHALPDLPLFQRILRKYGGGLVLGTQDLVSMRSGETDHAPAILGLANTLVTFRMTWPKDVEVMSRLLFSHNIDYTKLTHDVYQHQGEYDWLRVRETSRQWSVSRQHGEANGEGEDESEQTQESESLAEQNQWSKAKGRGRGTGTSDMNGWANAESSGAGQSDSPIIVDGVQKQTLRLGSNSASASQSQTGALTRSTQETETETDTVGGGSTATRGASRSLGRSKKTMRTRTKTEGVTAGLSESEKLLPLPKLVHVKQDTGQLIDSVADQYEKLGSELTSLPRQEGFVRIRGGKALRFRTADVPDAFASPEAQMKAVAWMKRRLYQTHDYFFTPSLEDEPGDAGGLEFVADEDDPILDEAEGMEAADEEESPLL